MKAEIASILDLLSPPPTCLDLFEQRDRLLRASTNSLLHTFLSTIDYLSQAALREPECAPYYALLAGAIALDQRFPGVSLRYLDQAVTSFRHQNDYYHQALTLWLTGLSQEAYHQPTKAQQSYKEARKCLDLWASLEDKRDEYRAIRRQLEETMLAAQQRARTRSSATPSSPSFDFLAWKTFPIHATVQAGADGPVWGEPEQEALSVDIPSFQIGTEVYRILSLKAEDHRVSLQRDRRYGWVRVHGNSMNAARPEPIVEGDLALFYAAEDAEENDFVIASCPDSAGSGYQYMLKRWKASAKLFLSESTEDHPPIPRDASHRILGVVVALARPLAK